MNERFIEGDLYPLRFSDEIDPSEFETLTLRPKSSEFSQGQILMQQSISRNIDF